MSQPVNFKNELKIPQQLNDRYSKIDGEADEELMEIIDASGLGDYDDGESKGGVSYQSHYRKNSILAPIRNNYFKNDI